MKTLKIIAIVFCGLIVFLVILSGHPYRAIDSKISDDYYYNFLGTEVRYVPMGNWFEIGNYKLNADPKTFILLGNGEFTKYGKDKNSVFLREKIIEGADPESFKILNEARGISKDKNAVYYETHTFSDIDLDSVTLTEDGLIKDKYSVYMLPTFGDFSEWNKRGLIKCSNYDNCKIPPLRGVDFSTFEILDCYYTKDINTAYYDLYQIPGSDGESFEVLKADIDVCNIFSKDKNRVYCNGKHISDADPKTFTLIENGRFSKYAEDKNRTYKNDCNDL